MREGLKEHRAKNGKGLAYVYGVSSDHHDDEALAKKRHINSSKIRRTHNFNCDMIDLNEYYNKKNELFRKLKDYPAIVAEGGNIYDWLTLAEEVGFDDVLRYFNEKHDKVYVGISAPLSALAKEIEGLDLACDRTAARIMRTGHLGLGITDDLIKQHCNDTADPSRLIHMDSSKYKTEPVIDYRRTHNLPTTMVADDTMYERDTITGEECIMRAEKNEVKNMWYAVREPFDTANRRFGNYERGDYEG